MSARPPQRLCAVADLADGVTRGFVIGEGAERREVFLHREAGRIRGYRNACPHAGTPLDMKPDEFLSEDGIHFLCRTHGALFRIEDGLCVAGPCKGERLRPEPLVIEKGWVLIGV